MRRAHVRARARQPLKALPHGSATVRQGELDDLCDLIAQAAAIDLHAKPGLQLVGLVQSIFRLETVGIFDADLEETYHAGKPLAGLDEIVHSVFLFATRSDDPEAGLSKRVLRLGELPVGALVIRGEIRPRTATAIASLAAATFDRYHALASENRTEAARQAEQLRTTVLDSLAHAYKTPLTAIRAAATGLAEMGGLAPAQEEMVTLIADQSECLNQLTNRLLQTARLEAKDLRLRMEDVSVAVLLKETAARLLDRLAATPLRIRVMNSRLRLRCDRSLIEALVTEYLDNAAKYANAGSTITLEARRAAKRGAPPEMIISVHSTGPVIPAQDHERIFDRYFRSTLTRDKAAGTGIGLAIARHAAQAHGGRVWVTSSAAEGTTFFAAIPVSPAVDEEP